MNSRYHFYKITFGNKDVNFWIGVLNINKNAFEISKRIVLG